MLNLRRTGRATVESILMGQQLFNVATQELTTIGLNRDTHSVVPLHHRIGGAQLVGLRFHVADAPVLFSFTRVAHLKELTHQIIATKIIGVLLSTTEIQISSTTNHQLVHELDRIAFVKTREIESPNSSRRPANNSVNLGTSPPSKLKSLSKLKVQSCLSFI